MKGTEVEFRFPLRDEKHARDFLSELQFIRKASQKDVYLDTESGGLFRRGIFLRERNGRTLDFKFNLEDVENRHEDCDEHSFSLPLSGKDAAGLANVCVKLGLRIPSAMDLDDFKRINGLREFVIIDKVREKFTDGEFTYCLDNVRGFGPFLEIESMAAQGADLESLKRRMMEKVSAFSPQFMPTGYIELFVRQRDFNLYMKGRYLFEEDKK
jgi:adenylate cyclase class IV